MNAFAFPGMQQTSSLCMLLFPDSAVLKYLIPISVRVLFLELFSGVGAARAEWMWMPRSFPTVHASEPFCTSKLALERAPRAGTGVDWP